MLYRLDGISADCTRPEGRARGWLKSREYGCLRGVALGPAPQPWPQPKSGRRKGNSAGQPCGTFARIAGRRRCGQGAEHSVAQVRVLGQRWSRIPGRGNEKPPFIRLADSGCAFYSRPGGNRPEKGSVGKQESGATAQSIPLMLKPGANHCGEGLCLYSSRQENLLRHNSDGIRLRGLARHRICNGDHDRYRRCPASLPRALEH